MSLDISDAHQPLVITMLLNLNLARPASLPKQKIIARALNADPLQSLDVSSTFDSVAVIRKSTQREVDERLREIFRSQRPTEDHTSVESKMDFRARWVANSSEWVQNRRILGIALRNKRRAF